METALRRIRAVSGWIWDAWTRGDGWVLVSRGGWDREGAARARGGRSQGWRNCQAEEIRYFPAILPRFTTTINTTIQESIEEESGAMASEHAEPKPKQSLMDKAKGFVADKIAHIPKPEASLDSVSFKSMSRECITLHSNVNVSNPYDHRLPICEVTYTLKCAGKVVASGTMPDPGWVAASDTTKLEIPAKVPYDFLISLMKDVGRDWDIDYELQVGLTIDLPIIGNFTMPLSTSGEFKLPTLKDMF
ncbi:hypothetical protein C2845_PM06G04430 [Panicum miliaceum]|uniref:Water stress and hypersensitive response domain-containing protein n=1 Tax=Panicum miliaceum TaxID=4540 RepID=A0A3L6RDV1_PANMI|nr:hypothetical protein C2845_PM06G04430 [Panicum miliaceum]